MGSHNNPNSTKDPYKTLFVARLSYELNEEDLRREFERYGRIRDVKLIRDKETRNREDMHSLNLKDPMI